MEIGLQLDIAFRLVIAALLGGAIGFEREIHGHPAGMRTHLLVSLGSAAFTVLGIFFFSSPGVPTDPSRIAAQIVSGIGFIGAGTILQHRGNIRGLTTAASLWSVAAIGMAAGAGLVVIAVIGTALILVVLNVFDRVEDVVHRRMIDRPGSLPDADEGRSDDMA